MNRFQWHPLYALYKNRKLHAILLFCHLTFLILSYFILLYHVSICECFKSWLLYRNFDIFSLWVCVCGYVSVGKELKVPSSFLWVRWSFYNNLHPFFPFTRSKCGRAHWRLCNFSMTWRKWSKHATSNPSAPLGQQPTAFLLFLLKGKQPSKGSARCCVRSMRSGTETSQSRKASEITLDP